jgi:hypothetical protein
VYGIEGTSSSSRANSSYTLDGSTPRLHQDSTTTATSNVLFYTSPLLEDTQHTLVIQNLAAGGGKAPFFIQFMPRALMLKLGAELQLDYFEVIRSTVHDGESIPTCEHLSPGPISKAGLIERQSVLHPGAYMPGMSRFNPQSSLG